LLAFPLAAFLYALQVFPLTGAFLMLYGTALWTGLLVTAGMIGLLVEVPVRHFTGAKAPTSLVWLFIPILYFGGYGLFAFNDQRVLQGLRAEYDAANAKVAVPFDETKHSLVLTDEAWGYAGDLTQDYGLKVTYSENENVAGQYLATMVIERGLYSEIRDNYLMRAAFIHVFEFSKGYRIGRERFPSQFCSLRMPAKPSEPIVEVSTTHTETSINGLPVRLARTVITIPDGGEFVLRGGTASPYPWFPRLILGCALNSANPSWDCFQVFSRDTFKPIVSSKTKFGGDTRLLAKALGLKYTGSHGRRSIDRAIVEPQLQRAVDLQLQRDIADLQEALANPAANLTVHSIKVLQRSPEVLLSLAPLLVDGIVRAAEISDNPYRYREKGKTLALLFGRLPHEVQDKYSDEMALIYRRADEANDGRHWLYEADPLLRFRRPLNSYSISTKS
jgi:hypothetical protein